MKLILASSGFEAPESVQKCIEFVGKPAKKISFAIINEAYAVEEGDHSWVVDDIINIRNNFGGEIEFINLLALPLSDIERRIRTKDVIFCVGGNTEYLMSVFEKTGFDKLLPKLLKEKVYVGSSAGSMVLGVQPPLALQTAFYGEELDYGIKKYLELIDETILPHLDSPHFNNFRHRDRYLPAFAKIPKAYFLSDTSALVVDDDKTYPIGKNYIKLENGQTTEDVK